MSDEKSSVLPTDIRAAFGYIVFYIPHAQCEFAFQSKSEEMADGKHEMEDVGISVCHLPSAVFTLPAKTQTHINQRLSEY